MSRKYYQPIVKNLSYGELARVANGPFEILLCWIFKTLRISVPLPHASAYMDDLAFVTPDALPQIVRDRIAPIHDEVRQLGVHYEFFYTALTLGPTEGYASVSLLRSEPNVLFSSSISRTNANTFIDEDLSYGFASVLQDGRNLVTNRRRQPLNYPPTVELFTCPAKTSIDDMLAKHLERVKNASSSAIVLTQENIELHTLEAEQQIYNSLIERGVLGELSPERVALMRKGSQEVPTDLPIKEKGGRSVLPTLELICWIMVGVGGFLFRNPAANQTQFAFRASILGIGLVGAIGLMVYRLIKATNS